MNKEIKQTPILKSFLDNDFYKFTMQNAVIKLFPWARAQYEFINRGNHYFPEGFDQHLKRAIDQMSELMLSEQERSFLEENCPYLDPTYLDYLKGYRYDPKEIKIQQKGSQLRVSIEGFWYRAILWEVPILALISELYYALNPRLKRKEDDQIKEITYKKMERYKALGVHIAEFGTRRRHSYLVHQLVMNTLRDYSDDMFVGSSNVHFSQLFNLKPIGTHSHEWFMFHGAKYGFKIATELALENWANVYGGDLGIALCDTYTTKIFFESFNKKLAKLFDGIRHDSGDPIIFSENAIKHYQRLKIDPTTKTIIFSDNLNPSKVEHITSYCKGKIKTSFGVGTNFTNDVGLDPLNIVIKLMKVVSSDKEGKWISAIKISDEKRKISGDDKMISLAKGLLDIN